MSRLDEVERISLIIEKRLQALRKQGWIVALGCGDHVRDEIVETSDGDEVCGSCSAHGFSGELGELGLDSEAIDMAEEIVSKRATEFDAPRLTAMLTQAWDKYRAESAFTSFRQFADELIKMGVVLP